MLDCFSRELWREAVCAISPPAGQLSGRFQDEMTFITEHDLFPFIHPPVPVLEGKGHPPLRSLGPHWREGSFSPPWFHPYSYWSDPMRSLLYALRQKVFVLRQWNFVWSSLRHTGTHRKKPQDSETNRDKVIYMYRPLTFTCGYCTCLVKFLYWYL